MSVTFAILHIENYIFDSSDGRILSETAQNQCPNTISCFKWQSQCGIDHHMEQLQITGCFLCLGLNGGGGSRQCKIPVWHLKSW